MRLLENFDQNFGNFAAALFEKIQGCLGFGRLDRCFLCLNQNLGEALFFRCLDNFFARQKAWSEYKDQTAQRKPEHLKAKSRLLPKLTLQSITFWNLKFGI